MTSKVLMCTPIHYGVEYSINPWMEDNIGKVDQREAEIQWWRLYDEIAKVAEVKIINGQRHLPDMVFAANAGKVIDKTFYPSQFKYRQRQYESVYWARWFVDKRYDICWPQKFFEGEGDYLTTSDGWTWAGWGFRSEISAVEANYRLQLKDNRFYHLDTCFAPLNNKTLLWYPDAFEDPYIEAIHICFKNIIEVSEEDALNFACNAVCIGNDIFIPKNKDVTPQLRALGFNVTEFDMSEFIKSGGACKCLVLNLD